MANFWSPHTVGGAGGVGDVDGPASSTDNAIVLFDGPTGKKIKNSTATIDGSGNLTFRGNENHLSTLVGPQFAFEYFSLTGLSQPFTNDFDATNYGALEIQNGPHGGIGLTGLTDSDKTALILSGFIGSASPIDAAALITVGKTNGAGGVAALSSGEIGLEINNGGASSIVHVYGNGDLKIKRGLYSGPSADPTHGTYLLLNENNFQITAPLTAGDPYLQQFGIITNVKLVADAANFSISGLGCFVATDPTNTHTFTQLIGIQNVVQHDGVGNILDAFGGAYSAHNVGAANITNLRAGMFVIANTGAGTVTEGTGILIENPTNDGSNNNITNAYGIKIQDQTTGTNKWAIKTGLGKVELGGNVLLAKGANVAAANDLSLGLDGNTFIITGNTQINGIATAPWGTSASIILIFTGTPTVKHNTAASAGFARLFLSGSADFIAANNSVIGFVYDGTQWQETFRKVA